MVKLQGVTDVSLTTADVRDTMLRSPALPWLTPSASEFFHVRSVGAIVVHDVNFSANVTMHRHITVGPIRGSPKPLGSAVLTHIRMMSADGNGGLSVADTLQTDISQFKCVLNTCLSFIYNLVNFTQKPVALHVHDSSFGALPVPDLSNRGESIAPAHTRFVYLQAYGDLLFTNCTFQNGGVPSVVGGAIALDNGAAKVTQVADGLRGGRLWLTVKNCTFLGNSGSRGGAVWVENYPRIALEGCVFENNTASVGDGGAVWIRRVFLVVVDGCVFRGN